MAMDGHLLVVGLFVANLFLDVLNHICRLECLIVENVGEVKQKIEIISQSCTASELLLRSEAEHHGAEKIEYGLFSKSVFLLLVLIEEWDYWLGAIEDESSHFRIDLGKFFMVLLE